MKIAVRLGSPAEIDTSLLVVPLCQNADGRAEAPSSEQAVLDLALGGTLSRSLENGDFRASSGERLVLYRHSDAGPERVLLVGAGARADLSSSRLRQVAGWAVERGRQLRLREVTVHVDPEWFSEAVQLDEAAQALTEGLVLGEWQFEELRSEEKADTVGRYEQAALLLPPASADSVAEAVERGRVVGAAQNYARELAVRPANIVNPRYLAEEAKRWGKEIGFEVTVLDVKALKKEGMSALLAVAAGSDEEPRFIAMEYRGAGGEAPVVLVGKGVTFDSGGLSLKTATGMETMKYDMSGAAAVLGAMRAIAALKLPVNVVGLIPAVENLPSGHSLRPGDVIVSHSGKTIEVLNTDAEGRLILADALSYAARYEPAAVVDIATLTGACVVALGEHAIGLMGTDQGLADELRAAAERSGERVWQLPLWDDYREQMKSEIADIKNAGGRAAGAITAATFLRAFTGPWPWAHLDIAGTAWAEKARPGQPKGPTGVGVRLFTEWVRSRAR